MTGILQLLGWSTAMLGNPWILIAGFIVAKKSPRSGEFWLRLIAAVGVCTVIQIIFDNIFYDAPSRWGFGGWLVIVSLSTVWATIIFLGLRKILEIFRRSKNENEIFD